MPNLEIFEGKSMAWILLMFLGIGIAALYKTGRDLMKAAFKRYEDIESKTETLLKENNEAAQKREKELKLELKMEREKSEAKDKLYMQSMAENNRVTNKILGVLDEMQINVKELNSKFETYIEGKC